MYLVRHPLSDCGDLLALPHGLGLADDRDLASAGKLELSRGLDVEHGVAVLLVVENDGPDGPLHLLAAALLFRLAHWTVRRAFWKSEPPRP